MKINKAGLANFKRIVKLGIIILGAISALVIMILSVITDTGLI